MGMDSMDFIGWASAYASYLHYIRHNYVDLDRMWPTGQKSQLNRLHKAHMKSSILDKDPEVYFDNYATPEIRLSFIQEARNKELHMFQCVEQYRVQQKHNKLTALTLLENRLNRKTVLAEKIRILKKEVSAVQAHNFF